MGHSSVLRSEVSARFDSRRPLLPIVCKYHRVRQPAAVTRTDFSDVAHAYFFRSPNFNGFEYADANELEHAVLTDL